MRYSIRSLFSEALNNHKGWKPAWRKSSPKASYDMIIVGGGGHGLGTAYYLAKEHGITNIAVIEKGWIGGGNTGRNTTICRSLYMQDESIRLYDHALKLWHGLSQELNYNVMFSPRGLIHLAHNDHDLDEQGRRAHANYAMGVKSEVLSANDVKKFAPHISLGGRYPILGGLYQARAGTARHDAVAWGYARAASALGVDIIENCEVTNLIVHEGSIEGVETTQGTIKAGRVGAVVSGHCSTLAEMAGFRLPIVSVPLQAFVSEPVKPNLDVVIMSNSVHAYVSQSDKGEMVIGAGTDGFASYSQRGSFDVIEHCVSPICEVFPNLRRLRMLRQWAGIVDVTVDRSPIISKTPVKNLFFNCGWGTGGFKATPGSAHVFAASMARGEMHTLAAPFSIDRFQSGALVEEGAASGVAH